MLLRVKGSESENMHPEQIDFYGYFYICMCKVIHGKKLETT